MRSLCPPDVVSRAVETESECAALAWAASGAMDLTGRPDGAPSVSPAAAYGLLLEITGALAHITARIGSEVRADPGLLLAGRAGLLNLRRGGQRTAGGAGRLLRTSDGWCAITLSRRDDIDSVPAILGVDSVADDPWETLTTAARAWTATDLADRAQLLGVPAAALAVAADVDQEPSAAAQVPQCPWRTSRIAEPLVGARLDGAVVVDLSSMWAGPLCAHLLGRAGARVVKVESTRRPDGARRGDPRFFDWLHGGHEQLAVDFHTPAGQATLRELVSTADVVLEASRPRALAQLGLAPGDRAHRDGQVWLSLTGYGRGEPMRVAFGDDAAVAGGLVGWDADEPVFCGDAIADPLTGICAALAVCCAVHGGGGQLIDLSMRATAAAFAAAPPLTHGPHRVRADGADWVVECPYYDRSQQVLRPWVPQMGGA